MGHSSPRLSSPPGRAIPTLSLALLHTGVTPNTASTHQGTDRSPRTLRTHLAISRASPRKTMAMETDLVSSLRTAVRWVMEEGRGGQRTRTHRASWCWSRKSSHCQDVATHDKVTDSTWGSSWTLFLSRFCLDTVLGNQGVHGPTESLLSQRTPGLLTSLSSLNVPGHPAERSVFPPPHPPLSPAITYSTRNLPELSITAHHCSPQWALLRDPLLLRHETLHPPRWCWNQALCEEVGSGSGGRTNCYYLETGRTAENAIWLIPIFKKRFSVALKLTTLSLSLVTNSILQTLPKQ